MNTQQPAKPIYLLFFVGLLLLDSCSRITPAGFWRRYHTEILVSKTSDQGPYGGNSILYWKSKSRAFSFENVVTFAEKNGWHFTDSVSFSADSLYKITGSRLTFPFTYSNFSDCYNSSDNFPRLVISDATLYRFTSGWIAIEPGNARQTDKNGYVVLAKDGRELAVYHLWGE